MKKTTKLKNYKTCCCQPDDGQARATAA